MARTAHRKASQALLLRHGLLPAQPGGPERGQPGAARVRGRARSLQRARGPRAGVGRLGCGRCVLRPPSEAIHGHPRVHRCPCGLRSGRGCCLGGPFASVWEAVQAPGGPRGGTPLPPLAPAPEQRAGRALRRGGPRGRRHRRRLPPRDVSAAPARRDAVELWRRARLPPQVPRLDRRRGAHHRAVLPREPQAWHRRREPSRDAPSHAVPHLGDHRPLWRDGGARQQRPQAHEARRSCGPRGGDGARHEEAGRREAGPQRRHPRRSPPGLPGDRRRDLLRGSHCRDARGHNACPGPDAADPRWHEPPCDGAQRLGEEQPLPRPGRTLAAGPWADRQARRLHGGALRRHLLRPPAAVRHCGDAAGAADLPAAAPV
mmetsp:Transcript_38388/g.91039  ORF Transcript_38388/g.91039 Transcript_38388/m.91039 type:complete len:374 (+) Transcript_38388:607-1728(+)